MRTQAAELCPLETQFPGVDPLLLMSKQGEVEKPSKAFGIWRKQAWSQTRSPLSACSRVAPTLHTCTWASSSI
eukprot:c26013_g1_i1 orf=3-218(-)